MAKKLLKRSRAIISSMPYVKPLKRPLPLLQRMEARKQALFGIRKGLVKVFLCVAMRACCYSKKK